MQLFVKSLKALNYSQAKKGKSFRCNNSWLLEFRVRGSPHHRKVLTASKKAYCLRPIIEIM